MHRDGRVWRQQQEHTARTGVSEWTVLRPHRLAGQEPSTSTCSFTRHPDPEMKNGDDLMIHRGGTGWRYWSPPEPKEYKNAYWKPTHPERNLRDPGKVDNWCYLSFMSLQWILDLIFLHKPSDAWLLGCLVTTNMLLLMAVRHSQSHESVKMFFLSVCILRKITFPYCKAMNIAMTVCVKDISCICW